jgi:hypothetical protein
MFFNFLEIFDEEKRHLLISYWLIDSALAVFENANFISLPETSSGTLSQF